MATRGTNISSVELVQNLQEIVIGYHILKAGGKQVDKVQQLVGLDASDVLKEHIDKVSFLDHACSLRVELL
jgi:hypothetical protein